MTRGVPAPGTAPGVRVGVSFAATVAAGVEVVGVTVGVMVSVPVGVWLPPGLTHPAARRSIPAIARATIRSDRGFIAGTDRIVK